MGEGLLTLRGRLSGLGEGASPLIPGPSVEVRLEDDRELVLPLSMEEVARVAQLATLGGELRVEIRLVPGVVPPEPLPRLRVINAVDAARVAEAQIYAAFAAMRWIQCFLAGIGAEPSDPNIEERFLRDYQPLAYLEEGQFIDAERGLAIACGWAFEYGRQQAELEFEQALPAHCHDCHGAMPCGRSWAEREELRRG